MSPFADLAFGGQAPLGQVLIVLMKHAHVEVMDAAKIPVLVVDVVVNALKDLRFVKGSAEDEPAEGVPKNQRPIAIVPEAGEDG